MDLAHLGALRHSDRLPGERRLRDGDARELVAVELDDHRGRFGASRPAEVRGELDLRTPIEPEHAVAAAPRPGPQPPTLRREPPGAVAQAVKAFGRVHP